MPEQVILNAVKDRLNPAPIRFIAILHLIRDEVPESYKHFIMSRPKSADQIKQLHQILLDSKHPEYSSCGEFLEQFALNAADILDTVTDSGLLIRGEAITTYAGFSLRILSSLFKLYLVIGNWEEEDKATTLLIIAELLLLMTLTLLTIVLDVLIAAIISVLLAVYFFVKEVWNIGKLLFRLYEVYSFNHWLGRLFYQQDQHFSEEDEAVFIEQLFFRKITLQRRLCREPDPVLQSHYEALVQIASQFTEPESADTLLNLYAAMNNDFETLEAMIQHWDPDDAINLPQIGQIQQNIISNNLQIQALLGPFTSDDAQNNAMMLNFAETSIGFYMGVAGIALALIAFLLCLSALPLAFVSPLIYIVPLVLGITMVVITLACLISTWIFNKSEVQHLELEILEKANSGKYSTIIYADMPKPMN